MVISWIGVTWKPPEIVTIMQGSASLIYPKSVISMMSLYLFLLCPSFISYYQIKKAVLWPTSGQWNGHVLLVKRRWPLINCGFFFLYLFPLAKARFTHNSKTASLFFSAVEQITVKACLMLRHSGWVSTLHYANLIKAKRYQVCFRGRMLRWKVKSLVSFIAVWKMVYISNCNRILLSALKPFY